MKPLLTFFVELLQKTEFCRFFVVVLYCRPNYPMNLCTTTKICLGVLTLTMGGLLYILFRPETLLIFHVIHKMGLSDSIEVWRNSAADMCLPEFVVFNLPAGLWATAYVLIINALFASQPRWQQLASASVIPLLGVLSEGLQVIGLVPGTADGLDALCYALAYLFIWI